MKNKIIYLFVAVAGLFFITSCDHNNPNRDKFNANPRTGYVRIDTVTNGLPSITSATDTLNLKLDIIVPVRTKPVTVKYKVESVQGVDPSGLFENGDSSITFPVGEKSINLGLVINQDGLQSIIDSGEKIVFKIVLTSTNDDKIIVTPDTGSTVSITFPCDIEVSGTYDVAVSASGVGPSAFAPRTIDLEQTGEYTYHADNLWGPDFVAVLTGDDSYLDQFPYPATLTIDPATNQVTITPENSDVASEQGTGSYSSCLDIFNLTLKEQVFQGAFDVNVVLTVPE